MTQDTDQSKSKDFFISYNRHDRAWAEWIAQQLEQEGYTTIIQAWDFAPGQNFVLKMHEALRTTKRTLLVLSSTYLTSEYTQPEWAATFARDPQGLEGLLVPVKVRDCQPDGLLAPLARITLIGLEETAAREELISGVRPRLRPTGALPFPGPSSHKPKPLGFPGSWPVVWTVPHRRNPFFTGRGELLKNIHETLTTDKLVAMTQAISGLGGIGKTQLAIELMHRYGYEYQAVLWASATSREIVVSDFIDIAGALNLPQKNNQDQDEIVKAVKRWLQSNTDWILILDDLENLDMIDYFLPSNMKGYILLTTRAKAVGLAANNIEIREMGIEEGATLLLRRAKIIAPDALLIEALESDRDIAKEISLAMDGLPLALDQAGAYIDENQRSLYEYLDLYTKRSNDLLKLRGNNKQATGHPESVTTTFSLSFEKVQQINSAAADLLYLCAFLRAESIPEEIIVTGAPVLGSILASIAADEIALHAALNVLFNYSLLRREINSRMLTIHRLVQFVLLDTMEQNTKQIWAERAVKAVANAFPDPLSKDWLRCQPYIAHVQTCSSLIEQWNMKFTEIYTLLLRAGFYMYQRGQYAEARKFYKQAQAILEEQLRHDTNRSDSHMMLRYSEVLHGLAILHGVEGDVDPAEKLLRLAIKINEEVGGKEASSLAAKLLALGNILHTRRNNYDEAEALYQRARSIKEKVTNEQDFELSAILNGLAYLYKDQNRYEEAENYYLLAQSITEKELGQDHPEIAIILNNRARAFLEQDKYDQAELLLNQALKINENAWDFEHPNVVMISNNLGDLYRIQGDYKKAEHYLHYALESGEKIWGSEHLNIATVLNHLGLLYVSQGKHAEAEQSYQRALRIDEKFLGSEHISVAVVLNNLGALYHYQRGFTKAEVLLKRAHKIFEKLFADTPWHHYFIDSFSALLSNYLGMGDDYQVKMLLKRSAPILTEALESGEIKPEIAKLFKNFLATNNYKDKSAEQAKKGDTVIKLEKARRWLM